MMLSAYRQFAGIGSKGCSFDDSQGLLWVSRSTSQEFVETVYGSANNWIVQGDRLAIAPV